MKQFLNDITEYIVWDEDKQKYFFLNNIKKLNFYNEVLFNELNSDNELQILSTQDVLTKYFPYINNINNNIIKNSLKKSSCIKNIIFESISQKKTQKIFLLNSNCKNIIHINAAKRYITEINKFCYKHNIYNIYFDKIFLYLKNNKKIITHIDLLLKNAEEWFQIEIKTSRVNYKEKYNANLFLNKKIIENANEIKIKNSYFLNIFEHQVIFEYEKISTKLTHKLLND